MKKLFNVYRTLAVGLLFSFGCNQPLYAPKLALVNEQITSIQPANLAVSYNEASKYQLHATYNRPEWVQEVIKRNPNTTSLQSVMAAEVFKPEDWQSWMVADTTWSLERLRQFYIMKNLAGGADWQLKDAHGKRISRWGETVQANVTSFCPKGIYGSSKGLTYYEWLGTVAVPQITKSPQFMAVYNGIMFDVIESCSAWDHAFDEVDYNQDGIIDGDTRGCVDSDYSAFTVEQRTNTERFINNMMNRISPQTLIIFGQNRVLTPSRIRVNGWKLENWMRQPGADRGNWLAWMYGNSNTPGYMQAENTLNRYGNDSPFDQFQGWDWSIINVVIPKNWSPDDARKFARFGLGTSMLGDGYYNVEYNDFSYYKIPEMFSTDWKMLLPALTDMYKVTYDQHDVFCREYTRMKDNALITIVVDPALGDAWTYEGSMMIDFGSL